MNRGKFKLWHVINCLIVLVILILAPQHTAAQEDDVKGLGQSLSPGMSVALVCITSIFLLIAFISLLINRFTNIFGRSPPSLPPGRGVDPVVVITFPTFLYSHVKGHWTGQRALECAICLLEFKDNQILRLLPKCSHLFHPACIDAWLAFHVTCPLCRANLVPNLAEQQKSNSPPGNGTRSDLVDLIIDISDTTTPELINTPMQNRSVPTST